MSAAEGPPLIVVEEWADEPEVGRDADEWPYPTTYTRSLAQGELAERIRRALVVTADLPVYVVEEVVSGGWSEFTPEDDYYLTISVGDAKHEVDAGWSGGLTALLRWLDEAASDDASDRGSASVSLLLFACLLLGLAGLAIA